MKRNFKKLFTKIVCLTIATVMLLAIPVGAATTTFGSTLSSDKKKITTTINVGSGSYFYVVVTGHEYDTSTKYYYDYSEPNSATGGGTLKIYHLPTNLKTRYFVAYYKTPRLHADVYQNTDTLLGTIYFYD